MVAALHGIKVVDLSESVAGQFCCRLLADYGAEVILVEPAGGSRIRTLPPISEGESLLFSHLNLGKSSISLDLAVQPDKLRLAELAEAADVVVVGPAVEAAMLAKAGRKSIVALVSDFGLDGPYRDWRGSEMIYQALSGMMYANGTPDREPLYGIGQRASIGAGVGAYITILGALYARGESGVAQSVGIDVLQTTCTMALPTALEHAYNDMPPVRGPSRNPFGVVRCRDAWICFWLYDHAWQALCNAVGRPGLSVDPRFITPETRQDNWTSLIGEIQASVQDEHADEIVERLLEAKLVASRAYTPLELWHSPKSHLSERGFWETVRPRNGHRLILGPPFRMSKTPRHVRGPAPEIGDDGNLAFASKPQSIRAVVQPVARKMSQGPLSGLRVLEFTTAWAGPMAGRILGFLGADVIHVESAGKLDLWRQHSVVFNKRCYPDGIAGERPYNRNARFNSQNQNKKSLCIDAKHPKGKAALMRLAASSDIVLCNFTAGTLERMGLGYEILRNAKADVIVVDMPGFGNYGAWAHAQANGFSMEMAAGMSSMIGYEGGPPTTTGPFYPDPIGGYYGAAAALTALLHRQMTGEGQYVEVPQVEASMQYVGEELLYAIQTGCDPMPQGNRVRWAAPHDAYQALGEQEWVAIAIETDAEWATFCHLTGQAALAADERFSGFANRHRNQDLLREPITAWTSRHSKFDIADRLQNAGIRAAPVLTAMDVLESPYMEARKGFVSLSHPDAGTHRYQTLPFQLKKTPGSQRSAAPCLGADTRAILSDVLGYSLIEIEELDREGITSNVPSS